MDARSVGSGASCWAYLELLEASLALWLQVVGVGRSSPDDVWPSWCVLSRHVLLSGCKDTKWDTTPSSAEPGMTPQILCWLSSATKIKWDTVVHVFVSFFKIYFPLTVPQTAAHIIFRPLDTLTFTLLRSHNKLWCLFKKKKREAAADVCKTLGLRFTTDIWLVKLNFIAAPIFFTSFFIFRQQQATTKLLHLLRFFITPLTHFQSSCCLLLQLWGKYHLGSYLSNAEKMLTTLTKSLNTLPLCKYKALCEREMLEAGVTEPEGKHANLD